MKLYPLKFKPILKSVIWGGDKICQFKDIEPKQDGIGESWEISDVKDSISCVANGSLEGTSLDALIAKYKGQLLGNSVYERFGNKFPLLIKFIDARQNLSIQVHPNDELAKKRHNSFGKTEMWYVIDAKPDAFLYCGFKEQINADTYVEKVKDNTFVDTLAKQDVKKGDVFFLPAGRVHAIGAGTFVAEIQQTSDITYRIYDYKRTDANGNERELHTDLAKDAIDFTVYEDYSTHYQKSVDESVLLETCDYFTVNLLDLTKEHNSDYKDLDSFVALVCMEGKADLVDDSGFKIGIKQGETVLLPAEIKSVKITPQGGVKLLEASI